jgi:Tol biopolymer transport system component
MGEVYKALDTRLDRSVAIKILPDSFAADPHLRERFHREGRAISQLTHAHICALYDVGDHQGTSFLVMEYLEGMTLAQRLTKGVLPLPQALKIAIEIASALDYAHRAGIVHRDLKPANIMLTSGGAKLLDFGLAKSGPLAGNEGVTAPHTTMGDLTERGTILGTFQYMSPEQIEGLPADARSDIFAFGVVLYEMLTSRKAFEGKSRASLMGAILKDDPPPVSAALPLSPPLLDRVVKKCLEKDREARWQSARDLHDELTWTAHNGASGSNRSSSRKDRTGWVVAAIVAVVAVAGWGAAWRLPSGSVGSDAPPMRLEVVTPPGAVFTAFAIAPNRRSLVYQTVVDGRSQIWLRSLDSDSVRPLAGTEEALAQQPFWSPDSTAIAFFTGAQLKRLDLDSGLVRTLAPAPIARGGSWGTQGTIVFAAGSAGSINAVSTNGGEVTTITHVDPPRQTGHRFPHFTADGRHFLYYATGDESGRGVYVAELGSSVARRLLEADAAAVFMAPDQVLFVRQGALWAQRLNLTDLQLIGEPAPVAKQVALNADLFGDVALGEAVPGAIVYRASVGKRQLKWFSRSGQPLGALGVPDESMPAGPKLAPDEQSVVFRRLVDGNTDLWSIETGRNVLRRLTVDAASDYELAWSPRGDRLAFGSNRKGVLDLYEMAVGGATSEAKVLLETPENKNVYDWSADGRFVLYGVQSAKTGGDLWALPLDGERRPLAVSQGPFGENRGRFSPDSRMVAFESNESGRYEIVVQTFPEAGRKVQVSTDGGTTPIWRADGRELYFRSQRDQLTAARITLKGTTIDVGETQVLFALPEGPNHPTGSIAWYAASRDGQRFLINTLVEPPSPITVLLNWKPGR